MPRKLYTVRQNQMLDRVHSAHVTRSRNRAELEQRIRMEMAKQLMADEIAESLAANEAIAEGVTGSDVRRALGIANWDRYKAVLALTADRMVNAAPVLTKPWTVNVGADGLPESVTLHEYKDKATGKMLVGDLVVPGKVNTDGYFFLAPWEVADKVDWSWITGPGSFGWEVEKAIGQVAEPKPPKAAAVNTNPGLDLPDAYFAPTWDPSMDLEDEDA